MLRKISLHLLSFFLPMFVRKKDYNIIVMRFDGFKFMFNTKVLFEYWLEHSDKRVKYIINDDNLRIKLTKKYGKHFITQKTLQDIVYIAKAGTWITDGGFPLKTPFGHTKRILINLWHGMPIKCIGLMGYHGLDRIRIWLQLKMFARHYNAFCVTSSYFSPIIEKSFLLPKDKIQVLGQPRNDLLLMHNDRNAILYQLFGNTLPAYQKIILYAPTYRGSDYGNASGLEPTRFFPFDDFNIDKMEYFLDQHQYIIFIRAHHLDKIAFKETKRVRFLNSDKISEISEILNIFDMLISDYSGMIYDYLLLDRPLMFLPYDLEVYREVVGMCYPYEKVSPGPKPETFTSFTEEITKLLVNREYYYKERLALKKKVFDITGGNIEKISSFVESEIARYRRA